MTKKAAYLGDLYSKDQLVKIIAELRNEVGILKNKLEEIKEIIKR